MFGSEQLNAAPPQADRWLLWMVRVAAIASVLVLAGAVGSLFLERDELERSVAAVVILFGLAALPYLVILWRLATFDEKRGLALAAVWGSTAFLVTSWLAFLSLTHIAGGNGRQIGRGELLSVLFVFAQIVLVAGAILWNSRPPQSGFGEHVVLKQAGGVAVFCLLALVVAAMNLPSLEHNLGKDEAYALRSLRRINECAAAYQLRNPKRGFPASLDLLGPDGENCISGKLAREHTNDSHFTFEYAPGAAEVAGRVRSYTIRARSTHEPASGRRFFSDESGVVRWVSSDLSRDANALDAPIQQGKRQGSLLYH